MVNSTLPNLIRIFLITIIILFLILLVYFPTLRRELFRNEEIIQKNEKLINLNKFSERKNSIDLNSKLFKKFTKNEIYEIWFTHKPFKFSNLEKNEFKSAFNKKTFIWYYDLLQKLFQTLTDKRIPYLLYSGSMIATVRHHGQIPWDDDMDIFISDRYKHRIAQILNSVPGYIAATHGNIIKFYNKKNSLKVSSYSKKRNGWPMVDIIFYETVNKTHFLHKGATLHFFKRTQLFPIRYRIFWNWILPAPIEIENIIEFTYKTNKSMCQDTKWNHKREEVLHKHPKTLHCSKFYEYFPFVRHVIEENECKEILMKNNTILRKIPCH